MQLTTPVAKGYGRNLVVSAAVQMFSLLLGCLALDGGQLAQWVIYSIVIYWVMALLVIARRSSSPTKSDLIAIRYGFIFILVGVVCYTSLRWAITGLSA